MTMLFVTGSGTDVGKTFVTALLLEQLAHAGRTACALKPIASGFEEGRAHESDAARLLRAQGIEPTAAAIAAVSPWRFAAPLSPDMAAARECRAIDFTLLLDFCREPRPVELTVIEGVGGVMVPIDRERTVLDWIVALGAPVLLVAGSYLGTLSHTLSAAGMLRARGVTIAAIVLNESAIQPVPAEETAEVLARFADNVPIRIVRRRAAGAPPPRQPDLLALIP